MPDEVCLGMLSNLQDALTSQQRKAGFVLAQPGYGGWINLLDKYGKVWDNFTDYSLIKQVRAHAQELLDKGILRRESPDLSEHITRDDATQLFMDWSHSLKNQPKVESVLSDIIIYMYERGRRDTFTGKLEG